MRRGAASGAPEPGTGILDELAWRDPTSAELVKLRYFVGLSMTEAARALGLPQRTVERQWAFAKAWLREEIKKVVGA